MTDPVLDEVWEMKRAVAQTTQGDWTRFAKMIQQNTASDNKDQKKASKNAKTGL